jgi:ribosomal protein S27E
VASYPSVLQQILRNHGRQALAALAGRLPVCVWEAARAALERMMTCRTPEGGFVRLRCDSCGHMKTIPFSCKSRLCPSCGWLHAQRLIESVESRLIRCQYRHLVFSVPRELREVFFWHRELLPQACHAAADATMEAFAERCRTHRLMPGMVATCHTFGRNLRFHVHVHLLVTEGALQRGGVWQPVHFLPARQYRKYWQYYLLTRLRRALPDDARVQRTVGRLFRKYPTGFIVNVESTYRSVRLALSYCCRYLARPPLGERRILAYDGKHVTFEYKDYKTGQQRRERCTAVRFVRLLMQHVLPHYARNIHYYGLYRPQARKQWFAEVRRVSRYPQNVGGPPTRPLTWRERILAVFKTDPVLCPNCGTPMVVHDIQWPAKRRAPPGRRTTAKERRLQLALPLPPTADEVVPCRSPSARSASTRRAG